MCLRRLLAFQALYLKDRLVTLSSELWRFKRNLNGSTSGSLPPHLVPCQLLHFCGPNLLSGTERYVKITLYTISASTTLLYEASLSTPIFADVAQLDGYNISHVRQRPGCLLPLPP